MVRIFCDYNLGDDCVYGLFGVFIIFWMYFLAFFYYHSVPLDDNRKNAKKSTKKLCSDFLNDFFCIYIIMLYARFLANFKSRFCKMDIFLFFKNVQNEKLPTNLDRPFFGDSKFGKYAVYLQKAPPDLGCLCYKHKTWIIISLKCCQTRFAFSKCATGPSLLW